MKASEWIDRVKKERGWDSDYRVAKELEFRPNTISQYRTHGTTLDEGIALKVANALGVEPEIVLLDQVVERSKNDEARTALSKALKRLGGVAASVGAIALTLGAAAPSSLCILCKVDEAPKKGRKQRRPTVFSAMANALQSRGPGLMASAFQ